MKSAFQSWDFGALPILFVSVPLTLLAWFSHLVARDQPREPWNTFAAGRLTAQVWGRLLRPLLWLDGGVIVFAAAQLLVGVLR